MAKELPTQETKFLGQQNLKLKEQKVKFPYWVELFHFLPLSFLDHGSWLSRKLHYMLDPKSNYILPSEGQPIVRDPLEKTTQTWVQANRMSLLAGQ